MLNSGQLEAFFSVAQTGNFTKAAARIHLTQSALSQRIRNLEEHLELSLFVRTRGGVHLTEAGFALLRHCQARMNLESDLLQTIRPKSRGKLGGQVRIGAYSSVMNSVVLPCLSDLLKAYPEIQLHCFTREVNELPDLLYRGEADFIVSNSRLQIEQVEAVELGIEKNVLVEAKDYTGAERYLDHDEADPTTKNYFRHRGQDFRGQRLFLDNMEGLIRGAELGLGRAVVPRHLLDGRSTLRILAPKDVLVNPVVLHYYSQSFYSRLQQAVVSVLAEKSSFYLAKG